MKIEIKSRWSGRVLFEMEAGSKRLALEAAVEGDANLRGANLRDANLRGANLRGANLRDANLGGANLRGADLRDADLGDADLGDANLRDANLGGADLGDANLRDANLRGANLRDANLRGADLRDANLRDANLRDANLRGADLRDADLGGAKGLPEDRDLLRSVCQAALGENALKMSDVHTCETTHCLAGWAVHLSGHAGYALERAIGWSAAGAVLIPRASHMFFESNGRATDWCRETLEQLDKEDAEAASAK